MTLLISHVCFDLQILEMSDPVEDERGYVYERESIVEYIIHNSGRGQVKCPVAG